MVVPCLVVVGFGANAGVGRAVIEAVEEEVRLRGRTGTKVVAYRDLPDAEWLMPAAFFECVGYEVARFFCGSRSPIMLSARTFWNRPTPASLSTGRL